MKHSKRRFATLLLALVLTFSISGGASAFRLNTRVFRMVSRCLQNPSSCTRTVRQSTPTQQQTQQQQQPTQQSAPSASTSSAVHAYEKEVVELVNQQRAAYGLPALTLSEDLCAKARMKSQDMASNRYFSHTSPTYGSPFDMMKSLGIRYSAAGENIAMGYGSPSAVVSAWMNSEGHRANILSANYSTIGVGYVASGNYWTQWFIG